MDEICPATLLAPRPACPDGGYSALRPPYAGPAALPGVPGLLERRPTARPALGRHLAGRPARRDERSGNRRARRPPAADTAC
ncbi:hypothetical protein ACQ88E_30655, partial [Streptomyces lividans]